MTIYCENCGAKNVYSGVKPKKCSACDELLEPKVPLPRQEKAAKRVRYIEVDDEPAETPAEEFQIDPRSFKFQKYEGGFMTIGELRKSDGGGFSERGASPIDQKIKDQVMGTMLSPKAAPAAEFQPPPDTRPTARRVASRLPPPPAE